ERSPGHDGETVVVVADDVDGMPAPRPRRVGPVEAARPVPDVLVSRPCRQLQPDVEPAEEPGARRDEIAVVARHPREGTDPVAADAARAPQLEHLELHRSLLAGPL